MLYIHIKEQIPMRLPKSWRNISGLSNLDLQSLINLGWYPIQETTRPEFDEIHETSKKHYIFNDTHAIEQWEVKRKESIPSVDEIKQSQIAQVKTNCGAIIINTFPEYKQRNLMARFIELMTIKDERELTQEELIEIKLMQDSWSWIKRQRIESNRLENEIIEITKNDTLTDDEKRIQISKIEFNEVQ